MILPNNSQMFFKSISSISIGKLFFKPILISFKELSDWRKRDNERALVKYVKSEVVILSKLKISFIFSFNLSIPLLFKALI